MGGSPTSAILRPPGPSLEQMETSSTLRAFHLGSEPQSPTPSACSSLPNALQSGRKPRMGRQGHAPSPGGLRGRRLTARLVRADGEVTSRRDGGRGSAMWRGQRPWAHRPAHPRFLRLGQMVGVAEERDPRFSLPPPRGPAGAWISSTQKTCGEKPYPHADLGQHANLVESQLKRYGT